jgi:hypothetical protein
MNRFDSERNTALELVSYARTRGLDLEPFLASSGFLKDGRWVHLWRKDEFPWSGSAQDSQGTIHYALQGSIGLLPDRLSESASAFHGMWSEAGTLENVCQAFELLKGWLVDLQEVDSLPTRQVSRYQI